MLFSSFSLTNTECVILLVKVQMHTNSKDLIPVFLSGWSHSGHRLWHYKNDFDRVQWTYTLNAFDMVAS